MNKSNYLFISNVSSIMRSFTQFPEDVCDFIACQFALESSYGESPLASANNNYCGMRNPLVRVSCAIHAGDPNFHWAQYADLHACSFDYLLCIQYHKPISTNYDTVKHYSVFISKFYCPEVGYIDKINRIYSQFNSYQDGKN